MRDWRRATALKDALPRLERDVTRDEEIETEQVRPRARRRRTRAQERHDGRQRGYELRLPSRQSFL